MVMVKIPEEIQKLVGQREKLRKENRYAQSDKIREKLENMGYAVADEKNKTRIFKKETEKPAPKQSFLVLFGSGEIAPSGVKAHNYVLERIGRKEPTIAIISTPAGFQPNVKVVYEEIAEHFEKHLVNHHPHVSIIYANTLEQANDPDIIRPLDTADYIFTGPGSPTYAVHHLRGSLLYEKIVERVRAGASLSLASAAAIAFSRFALPVYEIYKAGAPLYWEKGLNFYPHIFQELTIIPHFNNKEGGKKTDTSRCYMGKERFEVLLRKLPPKEHVWGIDEHTAVVIDLKTKQARSMGKGKLLQIR